MAKRLGWCMQCKEYSTKVRVTKEGKRIEVCLNAGHGYIRTLPKLEEK